MDNNRDQGQLEQQRQKRLAKLKYEAAQEYGLPAGQSLEPETEDDTEHTEHGSAINYAGLENHINEQK